MNERPRTRLFVLLERYGLTDGRQLAKVLQCTSRTAYRRVAETEKFTIRELRLLSTRGHIPIEEVRAAI